MSPPVRANMLKLLNKPIFSWATVFCYWALLTWLLVVSDPWAFLFAGVEVGAEGWQTSSEGVSILLHLVSYGILAGLLAWACNQGCGSWLYLWLGLAMTHALATEWLQHFVPGRWPNVVDALANEAGILIGFFGFSVCGRLIYLIPGLGKEKIHVPHSPC